jgi:hypothetical protein
MDDEAKPSFSKLFIVPEIVELHTVVLHLESCEG